MKKHVLGADPDPPQSLLLRTRMRSVLERGRDAGNSSRRRAWVAQQLRAHAATGARRTEYGRSVRGGDDARRAGRCSRRKSLRHGLQAFTTGYEWLSAPATTGGTSGVPLKVLRSLAGHRLRAGHHRSALSSRSASIRVRRAPSMLRGDNPRDIEFRPIPNAKSSTAAASLTMSANAVTHSSVEHIANELEKFGPHCCARIRARSRPWCVTCATMAARLSIPAVVTSSEVFRPEAWALVSRSWAAGWRTTTDRPNASPSPPPRAGRIPLPARLLVRRVHSVRRSAVPRDSQHRLYEIVGTSFWNSLLPIVRYRTGDLVRVPASWGERELEELSLGCARSRRTRPSAGAAGVPAGGAHHRHRMHAQRRPATCSGFRSCRKISTRRASSCCPTRSFPRDDAERLLANARARIPPKSTSTVEIAQRLERTPRGKTPLIVHRPPVHDALRRHGVEPLFTR